MLTKKLPRQRSRALTAAIGIGLILSLGAVAGRLWDPFAGTGPDPRAIAAEGSKPERIQALHELAKRVAADIDALRRIEHSGAADEVLQAQRALARARRHLDR